MTYRQTATNKYDIFDGDRRLATVHSLEVAAQVCREVARRDAKAAAEWATSARVSA